MKSLGIYVHIPYCAKKCAYCDFYSVPPCETSKAYCNALIKQIESYKKKYYTSDIAEFYPEPALVANLSAQIPMFINECGQTN